VVVGPNKRQEANLARDQRLASEVHFCQTNTEGKISVPPNRQIRLIIDVVPELMKRHATLPIGRTARLAYEIDNLRAACCKAAAVLMNQRSLDEEELEECAQLDDTLALAQRLLKCNVREIMLSRLNRRSRAR